MVHPARAEPAANACWVLSPSTVSHWARACTRCPQADLSISQKSVSWAPQFEIKSMTCTSPRFNHHMFSDSRVKRGYLTPPGKPVWEPDELAISVFRQLCGPRGRGGLGPRAAPRTHGRTHSRVPEKASHLGFLSVQLFPTPPSPRRENLRNGFQTRVGRVGLADGPQRFEQTKAQHTGRGGRAHGAGGGSCCRFRPLGPPRPCAPGVAGQRAGQGGSRSSTPLPEGSARGFGSGAARGRGRRAPCVPPQFPLWESSTFLLGPLTLRDVR